MNNINENYTSINICLKMSFIHIRNYNNIMKFVNFLENMGNTILIILK